MNWTENDFGCSKLKADYKKQLSNIWQLDSLNKIRYDKKEVFIPNSEIMYIADKNGKEVNFISAYLKELKKSGEISISYDKIFCKNGN